MRKLNFLLLVTGIAINAQQFKPAEITFTNGDQQATTVNYNTPIYTPQTFEVKSGESGTKKLGLNDLKDVSVSGITRFVKADIEVSRHPENLQRLDSHGNFNISKETRFIEQLVGGKVNLFKYYDENNKAFYFSTSDNPAIRPLLYKEYFISSGPHEGDKTSNKQYVQALKSLQCGNADYNNVRYIESSLVNYFNKINECSGETVKVSGKAQGYAEHKIFAGYSTQAGLTKASFGGGYELEYHLPFLNYSFSVAAAPGYFVFTGDELKKDFKDNSEISIPVLVRYYPVKSNSFKAYVGYSVVNFSRLNNEYTGTMASPENSNSFTVRNFGEIGARIKNAEIFTRFYLKGDSPFFVGAKYTLFSGKK